MAKTNHTYDCFLDLTKKETGQKPQAHAHQQNCQHGKLFYQVQEPKIALVIGITRGDFRIDEINQHSAGHNDCRDQQK
jgi:hypothetical protein